MTIRKWVTSSKEVMRTIPVDERATEIKVAGEEANDSELVTIKALGLIYLAESDTFIRIVVIVIFP